ncbi:MAG: hypothetical protein HQK68_05160 [Desulfamplus sp.]|nr:hypothetical protein [Desulfamplus sp.]
MIPGINTSGSYMHYQRQIAVNDTTLSVSTSQSASVSKESSSDYKVNLSSEKSKLSQEYSAKESALKQEHEAKIEQLETQYNREQIQIEQEYSMKKRAISLNIYA